MSRKVYAEIKVRVIFDMEDDVHMGDVVSELDYHFASGTPNVDILDTEILDWKINDSK